MKVVLQLLHNVVRNTQQMVRQHIVFGWILYEYYTIEKAIANY